MISGLALSAHADLIPRYHTDNYVVSVTNEEGVPDASDPDKILPCGDYTTSYYIIESNDVLVCIYYSHTDEETGEEVREKYYISIDSLSGPGVDKIYSEIQESHKEPDTAQKIRNFFSEKFKTLGMMIMNSPKVIHYLWNHIKEFFGF